MRPRFDYILCGIFCALSIVLAVKSFGDIGYRVQDAIVLKDYLIPASSSEIKVGYGGELPDEHVDLPLQGREMNDLCFTISNRGKEYAVVASGGDLDVLGWHRKRYPMGSLVSFTSSLHIVTRGLVGSAGMRITPPSPSSTNLTISLDHPIFRDLSSSIARLSIGTGSSLLPTKTDEIYFRASQAAGVDIHYKVSVQDCGLRMDREIDWAQSDSPKESFCIAPGEERDLGGLRLGFNHFAGKVSNTLGGKWNRVQLYGLKLSFVILLTALAFAIGPQTRWPNEAAIYGCATFLATIGLILESRDWFFEPHTARFSTNVELLWILLIILFHLRLPLSGISNYGRFIKRLLGSYTLWFLVYELLRDPFDGSNYSFSIQFGTVFKVLLYLLGTLVACNLFVSGAKGFVQKCLATSLHPRTFLYGCAFVVTISLLLEGVVRTTGGTEALTILGVRFYLPVILIPFLAFAIALLVSATRHEPDAQRQQWMNVIAIAAGVISTLIYVYLSGDNGGAALTICALITCAFLCTPRIWTAASVIVAGLLLMVPIALSTQATRFELAWGADEQRVLHYDQERNLRTARDLARAGLWDGQSTDLHVPAVVRSNIHNDLVTAYVAGYFGWMVLGLVVLAYGTLYNVLLHGLRLAIINPVDPNRALEMRAWGAFTAALVITAAVQTFWVGSAAIQGSIPLTGQDVQPLSASAISLVCFFGTLLGSLAVSHNISQS